MTEAYGLLLARLLEKGNLNGMAGHLLVVGEALVEIMRPQRGIRLDITGPFEGPFPSGAPAIAADAAARSGADVTLIATVGNDPFGRLLLTRLSAGGVNTAGMRVVDDAVTAVAFVAYDQAGGREFVFHVADAAPSRLRPSDLGSAPESVLFQHSTWAVPLISFPTAECCSSS